MNGCVHPPRCRNSPDDPAPASPGLTGLKARYCSAANTYPTALGPCNLYYKLHRIKYITYFKKSKHLLRPILTDRYLYASAYSMFTACRIVYFRICIVGYFVFKAAFFPKKPKETQNNQAKKAGRLSCREKTHNKNAIIAALPPPSPGRHMRLFPLYIPIPKDVCRGGLPLSANTRRKSLLKRNAGPAGPRSVI